MLGSLGCLVCWAWLGRYVFCWLFSCLGVLLFSVLKFGFLFGLDCCFCVWVYFGLLY